MCESIASFGISSFMSWLQFFCSCSCSDDRFLYFLPLSMPLYHAIQEMAAMEVAGGGEGLIAGGGPVFPGAGWAYVTVME
jgi:hypothetical protein